jgi:hypothetical protein
MIGNLRNMAVDMGSEVEAQNRQLDRINLKARIKTQIYFSSLASMPNYIRQHAGV